MSTAKKRGPGRPPKPAAKVAGERLTVNATAAERRAWHRAAAAAGMPFAQWARRHLNTAAAPPLPPE